MTAGQGRTAKLAWKRRCVGVKWGMWNVRSFHSQVVVGESGTLRIEGSDPEKPQTFCDTLDQAGISLCCISEVRWKGEGTITVGNHLIIYSGLPEGAPKAEQGVGIVLNNDMQLAWARADKFCEPAGSRLLRINLILNKRVINVISVYAPTYNTEAARKDEFYDQLNQTLSRIGSHEEVFIFGDFNARVSRSQSSSDQDLLDDITVGPFGLNHTNDNGERLLALCEGSKAGRLRVMSTFFPHKHYGTWFHQSSQKWFQIDHALASRKSAKFVMDVACKPGIGFDTDHRLVQVRLRFPPLAYQPNRRINYTARSVLQTKPKGLQLLDLKQPERNQQLNQLMDDFFTDDLVDEYDVWSYGLRRAAEKTLGFSPQHNKPQWKIDCQQELEQISEARQAAYHQWANGGDKQHYRAVCALAKKQVSEVLNTWWVNKARLIQAQVDAKEPQYQYAGFRELRSALHRRPLPKIRSKEGDFVSSTTGRINVGVNTLKPCLMSQPLPSKTI